MDQPPSELLTAFVHLYRPANGERLPASDAQGQPLADNAYRTPLVAR